MGTSRTRKHTEELVKRLELGVLWDEYGLVGDIVVNTLSFFIFYFYFSVRVCIRLYFHFPFFLWLLYSMLVLPRGLLLSGRGR